MTILDEIAAYTKKRIEERKKELPESALREQCLKIEAKENASFYDAIKKDGLSFICEVKRASPSKGLIDPEFNYIKIAKDYEDAGADALSVLTEPNWFKGKNEYLKEIKESVNIPALRKDFTIDPYMIYEAKLLNASAFLIIVSILSDSEIKEYLKIGRSLKLDAIVETHSEEEIKRAIDSGADIIGVNNRNLNDFSVDTKLSEKLRHLINKDILFVSESGVKDENDIKRMKDMGADAVLVGEALMRADNKKEKLSSLKRLI